MALTLPQRASVSTTGRRWLRNLMYVCVALASPQFRFKRMSCQSGAADCTSLIQRLHTLEHFNLQTMTAVSGRSWGHGIITAPTTSEGHDSCIVLAHRSSNSR